MRIRSIDQAVGRTRAEIRILTFALAIALYYAATSPDQSIERACMYAFVLYCSAALLVAVLVLQIYVNGSGSGPNPGMPIRNDPALMRGRTLWLGGLLVCAAGAL